MAGRLICLEGLDFAGKSTLAPKLATALRERRGIEVVECRAPGGTAIGTRLREIVNHGGVPIGDPYTRECLHIADASELTATVIVPALRAGQWVISDRYLDSTRAYAIGGLGLDEDRMEHLIAAAGFAAAGWELPHQVLWLWCPVAVTLARMAAAGGARDQSDAQGAEFRIRVHNYYAQLADRCPWWAVIDATESPAVVLETCLRAIDAAEVAE